MIVDASALLSLIFAEPTAGLIEQRLEGADALGIGAPTLTEVSLVLGSRLGRDPMPLLGRLLQEFAIVVVPFSSSTGRRPPTRSCVSDADGTRRRSTSATA